MEPKICLECGSSIDCHYFEPERVYSLIGGVIMRNDNNDAFGEFPEFQFLCSNDIEHKIEDESDEFLEWRKEFIDSVIKVMEIEDNIYNKMD